MFLSSEHFLISELWSLLQQVIVLDFSSSLQASERMKIVDVIGEKVYQDGERIISQVLGV